MNLQAIKRACNEAGGYHLITARDGQQWIGNGAAFWPVEGITLTEGAIPVVFDFSKGSGRKPWCGRKSTPTRA